ncbi:CPBP family intramembrane glutamic endopeptidase [Kineococcus glutinatus]|uniref:CAAX prenyl protease 2/Lysostaphin resistance protein A-like domain-containing protein n=1 Tax=Kineococcus glutinatus TaxID=1070872 RepID=A0ABP8V9Q4_9ACTN
MSTPATPLPVRSSATGPAVPGSGLTAPGRFGWPATLALFLVPGAACTLWALAVGPLLAAHGLPAVLAGSLSPVVPLELVLLLRLGRRATGRWGLRGIVGFRRRLPWWRLVATAAALYLAGVGLHLALDPLSTLVEDRHLGWMPDALAGDTAGTPHTATGLLVLLLGSVLLNGLVHPLVEELYFRGWLLPRMPVAGTAAVVANAALFSLQHFWQPQLYLLVFLVQLLVQLVLVRCGDLRVPVAVHCAVNLTGGALAVAAFLAT